MRLLDNGKNIAMIGLNHHILLFFLFLLFAVDDLLLCEA